MLPEHKLNPSPFPGFRLSSTVITSYGLDSIVDDEGREESEGFFFKLQEELFVSPIVAIFAVLVISSRID